MKEKEEIFITVEKMRNLITLELELIVEVSITDKN
jgi:hypothetical protein